MGGAAERAAVGLGCGALRLGGASARNEKGEAASAAQALGSALEASAERNGYLATDCEPDPRPLVLSVDIVVRLDERFENDILLLGRNADAGVRDDDLDKVRLNTLWAECKQT